MICAVERAAVWSWLRQASIFARRGDVVVLCTPYVDMRTLASLGLAPAANVHIVTTDSSAGQLRAELEQARSICAVPHLHAKVYARWAREAERTEVIVTSANLTSAGLSRNLELGVLARGDCPDGRRLIRQFERFLAMFAPIRSFR